MILNITEQNYKEEVLDSDIPVILDFYATWCGPCKVMSGIIEEIASQVEGKAKIGKIDVDAQPQLASSFKIMSIPTIVIMKDGKVIKEFVGVRSKEEILKEI